MPGYCCRYDIYSIHKVSVQSGATALFLSHDDAEIRVDATQGKNRTTVSVFKPSPTGRRLLESEPVDVETSTILLDQTTTAMEVIIILTAHVQCTFVALYGFTETFICS